MYRLLLAVSALAFPLAAAHSQAGASQDGTLQDEASQTEAGQSEADGRWGLARAPGSCMLHASSPQGTMLSVWGFAGQSKIGFLLQNKDWDGLREGQKVDLDVAFVGMRAWPVKATERREVDSDGPGYFFTVQPGDGAAFLDAFASAKGMEISRGGDSVDSLPLAGSREAMSAFATCVSSLWAQAPARAELEKQPSPAPVVPTT
jgi:hypothetical protein